MNKNKGKFSLPKNVIFCEKCNFLKDDSVLIIGCLSGYSMALISNMVNYVFGTISSIHLF